ncbi:hypothetical protein [Paraburkholderia youngii]|uniref:hypothetical protein n=1 Tax=Paraburkholderia youngii TaxID=2782701 RepID=UPI003D1E2D1E
MEQTSFFSGTGTTTMPSADEFATISGVDVAAAIESISEELTAYFRGHVRALEILETITSHATKIEIQRRARERYASDPGFRQECSKKGSGQRYIRGFARTWIADVIRTELDGAHKLLPIAFRATGLAIPQGCSAPR